MDYKIHIPATESDIRRLHIGDNVLLDGIIYTGRDAFHSYAVDDNTLLPFPLEGYAIYHCGPITVQNDEGWKITAAGPTTSSRMEPYVRRIIEKYRVRAFIGKGGLGISTLKACEESGCVYLSAVGGCAQVLSETIKKINNVYFYKEFGPPEAVWELEVRKFPTVVTMDSHGGNLHMQTEKKSFEQLQKLFRVGGRLSV